MSKHVMWVSLCLLVVALVSGGGCSRAGGGDSASPAASSGGFSDITSAGDTVFFGSNANPQGAPFGVNPEPSSVGTANDAGIFYNDGQDGSYAARVENLFDKSLGSALSRAGEATGRSAGSEGKRPKRSTKTWKRSRLVPNTTRLLVGDKETLPLLATQATVEIDGFRARVVLDLTYRNDHEEQLQGMFSVRLPEGASPYYLAFGKSTRETITFAPPASTVVASIRESRRTEWETPKEARVVPKVKAAHAFAEIVRQKIDPALLEWAGAGVFSARVFPLEAGALHRITFGYEVNLVPVGEDLVYRLDLPEEAGKVDVDISVRGLEHEVVPALDPNQSHAHWRNPTQRTFIVRGRQPGNLLLTGEGPAGAPYFAARVRPALPAAGAAAAPTGAQHRNAVFLVDTSLSSNPDAFRIWLQLMQAVLAKNRDTLDQFAVVFFGIDVVPWRDGFVANTEANAAAVAAHAEDLALEGATDLARALAATQALPGDFDLFLLSDGAATWGASDLHAINSAVPSGRRLLAYATGRSGTDLRVLRHLTRESGGAIFAVTSPEAVARAAVAHTRRPWHIDSVTTSGGTDLILAGRPSALYPGQVVVVGGRGQPAPGKPLVFILSRDGQTHEVRVPLGAALSSPSAAGLYGRIAVGQLASLGTLAEDTARAYATHFRVVGPTCSLLMLETEADYARFDIKPEADAFVVKRKPVRAEVTQALAEAGATLGDPRRRVLAMMSQLAATPGVRFEVPAALRTAIDVMPAEAFVVPPSAMGVRARTWSQIPGSLHEHLAARTFTYDGLTAEGERRGKRFGPADALKALSTLVEHRPGDLALARDVAYSALALGLPADAFGLFRRVAEARPYEPHTYHAMAQCLARLSKNDLALVFFEVALAATWSERYGEFERIVAFDYLRFLREVESGERETSVPNLVRVRREILSGKLGIEAADIVVVIAWSTDRTDVDLHVTDPTGELCYYSHPKTKMGGHLTRDVTGGFGPEMFVLKNARRGTYKIEVKYFSSDTTRLGTRTKVHATVYEDWGRPSERVTQKAVLLETGKEMHTLLNLRWRRGQGNASRGGAFARPGAAGRRSAIK